MNLRNFSLQPQTFLLCFFLQPELVFKLLLLLSEFLLDLLQEARLVETEFFGLFTLDHELILVVHLLLSSRGIVETVLSKCHHGLDFCVMLRFLVSWQRCVVSVVEALIHEISDFWAEFLAFLVPAPLVDLCLTQS